MAVFPAREADVLVLAQNIIQGLNAQGEAFPKSPYTAAEIQALLDAYIALRDALTILQAKVSEATTAKNGGLDTLTDAMKAVLRYVEGAAASEEQLAHFGWSGRRPANALAAPGQCRMLEAVRQGPGWLFLDWKEPADGGKPACYIVQMRTLPDGPWVDIQTVIPSETTLVNLPRGKDLEFRVFARNKAGDGPVSNVVEVVV